MIVLGIESSCDEAAAAVVRDGSALVSLAIVVSTFWWKLALEMEAIDTFWQQEFCCIFVGDSRSGH